jgi:hypothetical protein
VRVIGISHRDYLGDNLGKGCVVRGIVFDEEGLRAATTLELRDLRPDDVRVELKAAGVCHSDVSVVDGETTLILLRDLEHFGKRSEISLHAVDAIDKDQST